MHISNEDDDKMSERWIETFSGFRVRLPHPSPDTIHLHDVAHALSYEVRFVGQCRRFYSVAQHSIVVSKLLEVRFHSDWLALLGLLHDGAEAYIGDVSRPVRLLVPAFVDLEACVQSVVEQALLPAGSYPSPEDRAAVRWADDVALASEAAKLMHSKGQGWSLTQKPRPGLVSPGWTPAQAKNWFLSRYHRLRKRLADERL